MLTNKGTLPGGIEVAGKVHRDYELREQLVADEIEVMESADAPRATKSDGFFNCCIIARRLTIAGLPKEAVTPGLVMGMISTDFSHLMKADKAMAGERQGFRDAADAATDAAAGTP
jgi:hypothetical protein